MTDDKRQEMKEYKEKAMAFEHKLKGKRISLDSGVMITSTELQKLENYESPTIVLKESICYDSSNFKNTTQNTLDSENYISPETPTLISEKEEHNLNDNTSDNKSMSLKSEHISLIENICDTMIPNQESIHNLTVDNLSIHNETNLNDNVSDKNSLSIKSDINISENSCNKLISKQETTHTLITNNMITHNEGRVTTEQIPRIRSNSYTLSSPSPIMVAFLNSQVQQQLLEPKSIENNINYIKESKSEPPSIYMGNKCDEVFRTKSISLQSVPKSCYNQDLVHSSKYKLSKDINGHPDNKIIFDQSQVERESVTTIETNLSNDESLVGSVITVFNGNIYENNSSPSSMTCSKSIKHCCCRHSDDEYSLSSNNIHYKTPEELNQEVERLRIEKLDIEKRHQAELSNLIKKQREEQEKIAVKYYLVTQSTSSGVSLDNSDCSESTSKSLKTYSSPFQSEMTVINDKSLLSDTSSIISSSNKNLICSSPNQKTPSNSPYLRQNIKLYNRISGGLTRWTKAPTEVENAASTVINAGVRGYLTRRLLRTEKAQLLKKTILDSLKTALIMHMELKKQQPTESDLELHRRIINQVSIIKLHYLLLKRKL